MPARRTTEEGFTRGRVLRKQMTAAESKLWAYLRRRNLLGVRFRRQHPIGLYVADFCSPQAKLIIEVDGSRHREQEERDSERSAYLNARGYRVIRFWNNDVLRDIEAVGAAILSALGEG